MYIFISVIYFLLLFQSGNDLVDVHVNNDKKTASTTKGIVGDQKLKKADEEIAKNPNLSTYQKKKLTQLSKSGIVTIREGGDLEVTKKAGDSNFDLTTTTKDSTYREYLDSQRKLPATERDGFIERMYNKKAFSYNAKYGARAREVFMEEFRHNVPKMMFLLLPLFAFILKVSFWRSKKFYVEHLIYSFHFHCFLFLFLAILMLLQLLVPFSWTILTGLLNFIATLYIIWYAYKSLRTVYHRSGFRTITKMIGMGVMYTLGFTFCVLLVLLITAVLA